MARKDGLVVARTSFFIGNRMVRAGDVWAEDDPVVRHYPSNFRELAINRSVPESVTAPQSRSQAVKAVA